MNGVKVNEVRAIATVTLLLDDERWHACIDVDAGLGGMSVDWVAAPGVPPGVLLNRAIKWADDRGLRVGTIHVDILKDVVE